MHGSAFKLDIKFFRRTFSYGFPATVHSNFLTVKQKSANYLRLIPLLRGGGLTLSAIPSVPEIKFII